MAADQERADRIRALKKGRPDLTWRRIADYVGVTERSATDWQTKGGMEYANAEKLAELFEVDVDYIWRGPSESERAPSPFAGQDAIADRLDAIEQLLSPQGDDSDLATPAARDIVTAMFESIEQRVTAQLAEHSSKVEAQLSDQSETLAEMKQTLASIDASVVLLQQSRKEAEDARRQAEEARKEAEAARRRAEETVQQLQELLTILPDTIQALSAASQPTVEEPERPAR